MKFFLLLTLIYCLAVVSSNGKGLLFLSKDSLTIALHDGWRFSDKDSLAFADSSFDDSRWEIRGSEMRLSTYPRPSFNGIGWFRLQFIADTSIVNTPLVFTITHLGASEIYLNGQLIRSFGKIDGADSSTYYDPQEIPSLITIPAAGENVFSIRYANYKAQQNFSTKKVAFGGFRMALGLADQEIQEVYFRSTILSLVLVTLGVIFITLSLFHFLMFLFYRAARYNLSFSIFMFCLAAEIFIGYVSFYSHDPAFEVSWRFHIVTLLCAAGLSLSGFIHELFINKKGIRFRLLSLLGGAAIVFHYMSIPFSNVVIIGFIAIVSIEALFTVISAMIKKVKGVWIIGTGIIFSSVFLLTMIVLASLEVFVLLNDSTLGGRVLIFISALAVLSIPISMSVYLGWKVSAMNKDLSIQLEQVKVLSEKNVEQEREKKRLLENRKDELEKEVAERTVELKASQQQLIQQEKLASLGQLTAGIAHEIKNPLNFVTNFADLSAELIGELESEHSPEERKQILSDLKKNFEKITHHGKRADSIVKNMLDHSRGSKGEQQLTDINQLSSEFFDLAYHGMRATVADFNCEMKRDLGQGLPSINVVAQDISRVLLNLFNNAFYAVMEKSNKNDRDILKYNPEVSLTTLLSNDRVVLKIRDNGNGIPTELKEKIFNPFFTTKPTGKGTGLGLSLSYDIVKAHGGEISVESNQDEFTEFIIALPLQ